MNARLHELLNKAVPKTRHYISDGITNGDLDESAEDFVTENQKVMPNAEAVYLCNSILEEMGQEPIFIQP